MALVKVNNNRAMVNAAKNAATIIGGAAGVAKAAYPLIEEVVLPIVKKFGRKKGNGKTDVILHPGALPGAIAAPVAVTRQISGSKPRFRKGKGVVTISHRELIGQFNNSAGFVVNSGNGGNLYRVNPSNSNLFTWLQTLAANFDQYQFISVSLHYVPLCATTETGRFGMYFDKDSQDPEPASRVELANMAHLRETAPWAEAVLNIPVDNVKRFTNDSNTSDPKLLDLGQVGFSTYGGSGTNPIGDVFISYTVSFFEPQPSSGLIQTSQTGVGASNYGPQFITVDDTATSSTITFRSPGIYLVTQIQRSTSFLAAAYVNGVTALSQTTLMTGTLAYTSVHTVQVPVPGGQIQFTGTGFGFRTTHVARARLQNNSTLL